MSKRLALGIGFASFALVTALDYATSPRISLLLLYLAPVLLVTWQAGGKWGLFFAFAMTASHALLVLQHDRGLLQDGYFYLDWISDLAAILLLVGLQAKLRGLYNQVNRLARHDVLTHCLNRHGFYAALESEIARQKRHGQAFSLIYFDCDNFKYVNDTQGHHTGDRLLMAIAATLQAHLRSTDAAGRLGGDEFAVLLPQTGAAAARTTSMHIKEQLDGAMQAQAWPVSFSIGAATFETIPDNLDQAIERADGLMYEVKKSGKNNTQFRTY